MLYITTMEFIAKTVFGASSFASSFSSSSLFSSEPFVIGSCVKGTSIDGIFVKGVVCVSLASLPNLDVTRDWITKEKYESNRTVRNPYFTGPTYESNWLIRKTASMGGFAVGGYPDELKYLSALKAAGLQTFVCLNTEYGKTVKGDRFWGYGCELPKANFIHEPINDMETVKDETVIALAQKIVDRLLKGEGVYLHCAGGHGRTGTVALVVLHMLYPELTELELFEFVQYAHDQRGGNYFGPGMFIGKMFADPLAHHFGKSQVPTPQTLDQRNQVRRINGSLDKKP